MSEVIVSIDSMVIDFTYVHWDFYNEFHNSICHFYGVKKTLRDKGFRYHINTKMLQRSLVDYMGAWPRTHKQ